MSQFFKAFAIYLCTFVLYSYAQDFSRVDRWLEKNTPDMGGRSLLMIYKKGMVYEHAVNDMKPRHKVIANILAKRQGREANNSDFTPATRLPIASCSKWLSAALVMTFVDEGKLLLTDRIGKFLPVMSLSGKGNITISQTLSHTTGIQSGSLRESIEQMKNAGSMDESIRMIAGLPMEGRPGTVFHYSNTGLQLAAAVIEKISGKDFETLFRERISVPLEMKQTDFGNKKVPLPAGGALSTAADYMNFLIMILNKGEYKGKRILSEKSIFEMQVNRITSDVKVAYSPAEAGNAGYGYGVWVWKAPDATNSVTSPGLFGSFPVVDHEKGYCAFMLSFNINSKGRGDRYLSLKKEMDSAMK